jgi:hypothetical protein
MLIKPKPFTLTDMDGEVVDIILSRFPATVGREIAAKYPMSNMPKIGDYKVSHDTMIELMRHVAIPPKDPDGKPLAGVEPVRLQTREMIDSHLHDAETLMKVEHAMLEYNFSFFQKGRISDFFEEFVQMMLGRITATLTPSSAQSSTPEGQPSTSSEPSTISKTPS